MQYREEIERFLTNSFEGKIHPLTIADFDIIDKFKNGNFGFSFCAFMLYANGLNLKAMSDYAPMGLLYFDEDNIFSIGVFKKEPNADKVYIHIIAPVGRSWSDKVEEIKTILSGSFDNISAVCVRHINQDDYSQLIGKGYLPISEDPWDEKAPAEDETFNHRLVDLHKIITKVNNKIVVKSLETEGSRNFRVKTRSAFNRFNNFLDHNSLRFNFYKYTPDHRDLAKEIVNSHFRSIRNRVGSTPNDYYNLMDNAFCDDKNFFSYIGFLEDGQNKIPLSFFAGEKIENDSVALYATFALRNYQLDSLPYNVTGFSAISQYCYIRVFNILRSHNIRNVDLGGSEVEELNTFKRQLGAKERKTYWALSRG